MTMKRRLAFCALLALLAAPLWADLPPPAAEPGLAAQVARMVVNTDVDNNLTRLGVSATGKAALAERRHWGEEGRETRWEGADTRAASALITGTRLYPGPARASPQMLGL